MTKNEILKKIGIILIELREQYDLTQLNRDDMNDIELELFAANSHFLTDHIEILRKLNSKDAKPKREEPKFFEPVVKAAAPETKQSQLEYPNEDEITATEDDEIIAPVIQAEVDTPPIIRHELVLDEPVYHNTAEAAADEDWATEEEMATEFEDELPEDIDEPVEEPATEQPVVEEEPTIEEPVAEETPVEPEVTTPEPIIATQIIIEDDEEDKPIITINQILSAQASSSRFSAHELQPISDLKSAITLNDKLLFVRDLFNGYSMAYGEAIEILNRFSRFEEADNFLKTNYYTKNNWEVKQATTDKFYELLQRRFQE